MIRWEFAELNFEAVDFERDTRCTFVPYGDYDDDEDGNMGEKYFESYLDAFAVLSAEGWSIAASVFNPKSEHTKLMLQRPLAEQGDE